MAELKNKTNDEYIDVAGNADYQNQSKIYYREFLNWRSSGNNPYAYSFVRRKNEHSYVDGKGYISKNPQEIESKVLKRCCRLIAMTMFTILLLSLVEIFYVSIYMKSLTLSATKTIYSEPYERYDVPMTLCLVICGMRILKLLLPILVFVLDTRIPREVVLPKGDRDYKSLSSCAYVMALMTASFCKIASEVLAAVCEKLGVGVYRFEYMYSDDVIPTILFGLCNCIVISALHEILFRGLILQTMRQFGDMFSFIICCVAEAFCGFDITSIGYTICIGIVITLFTLRTGSITTAIGMRITATTFFFALDLMNVYFDESAVAVAEVFVCITIIAVSLIIYSRITLAQNFSFNINNSKTHISIAKKLAIFFSHSGIMLWLIITLTVSVLAIRFV